MLWFARYSEAQTLSPQRAAQMAGKQPEVPNGYDLYLDVFFRLNSERHNGDGHIGSIPATKILEYVSWLDVENVYNFIEVITRMDSAYVNAVSKQIRAQIQQASKG